MILHARVITGTGGGPDKTIINSPRMLAPHGYRCACLFLHPPGDAQFAAVRERAALAEAPLVELDDPGPWSWGLVDRVSHICEQYDVDVWHAHDYKTNLLGLLVKRRRPALRLITTSHGWVERTWRTLLYHQIDRLTLRRYERVVAVSPDIEVQCRSLGVRPERLSLIENAIDVEQYKRRHTVAAAKQRLGWNEGDFVVGAVGRLSQEKGFDVLIRAFAKALADQPDARLVIAGAGPALDDLKQLAHTLNLAERVNLIGFQANLIPLYEAFDMYVLSSRREGLPNVLLEAMALETPVIATNIAGVPRLLDNGECGLLVPPDDVDQLAAALTRLRDDGGLRQRLGEAGRNTILARYSFAVRMAKIAALYDDLLCRP